MSELKSEGKCVYCEKMYSQSGMSRHLSTHLKAIEKEKATRKKAYHLKVTAAEMFLHLLVDGQLTFGELDNFLRAIWLECCGHMSSFEVKGKQYEYGWDALEFGENQDQKVSKVFKKGVEIVYQYDFGSTTRLDLKVLNEYKINAELEGVELLSRNEPLEIGCHACGKNSPVVICNVCMYSGPSFFCKSCAKKHEKTCDDFAEYAKIPVVNSPRMGVCAYEGGQIDTERDGPFSNKK